MQVRLHGSDRPAGLIRDLPKRQIAEEAQGDDLSIRLVKSGDGLSNVCRTLGLKRDGGRVRPADQVAGRSRIGRVEPRDRAPPLRATDRDPNGDPRQPGTEGAVFSPCSKRAERGHERLLGCVFGLMEVAEHAVAGTDDGRTLALDKDAERIAISGQDATHDDSVVIVDSQVC